MCLSVSYYIPMNMPKHTRSSSLNQNRYSNPMPVSLAPSAPMPIYTTRQQQQIPMNQGYYQTIPSSTTAQASMQQQQQQAQAYDPYPAVTAAAAAAAAAAVVTQPPMPHRASSGAWTPQDDQNLLQARQQGLNWAQIQNNYFPNKTPNACRKRHERLMERKGADDWDQRKLERMAKEYISLRKEIWQPLAQRTGEKWNVVESMVSLFFYFTFSLSHLTPSRTFSPNFPLSQPPCRSLCVSLLLRKGRGVACMRVCVYVYVNQGLLS